MPDVIAEARRLLATAPRVLIFTGAGVSAESGIPTFRGPGGLWKTFRAEDLATPQAFARDPRLVWEWYGWRRGIVAGCRPNAAHVAIARWMMLRDGVTLVTQNVDDLHERGAVEAARALVAEGLVVAGGERAALERAAPVRLHGALFVSRCSHCGAERNDREPVDASSRETLPRCSCGGLMRPGVVWFGESLPEDAMRRAFAAAGEAEACLVVGTAGAVHPAAAVVHATAEHGGAVMVVDPGPTAYDEIAEAKIVGKAGEVLPEALL